APATGPIARDPPPAPVALPAVPRAGDGLLLVCGQVLDGLLVGLGRIGVLEQIGVGHPTISPTPRWEENR
ncbi:MAG: hypothetical protein ACRD0U_06430, partial [Acidimicrobiales bacterium]